MKQFLFFVMLCLILPHSANAVEVPMSVTSDNSIAETARAEAIEKGERRAFYAALNKLAPDQSRDIYRKLRDKDLSGYIESYTVTREVQRAGHYEADVIYRVEDSKILALVKKNQGIFDNEDANTPPQGDGLLIIPAYDAGDGLLLWQRENIWRKVLNEVALEVGQGALVMPFGDPRDIALLQDSVVITGNKPVLAKLAQRYGTRNVVIALARSRTIDDKPVVEVILRKPGAKADEEITKQYITREKTDTLEMLLSRAARGSSEKLMKSLKNFGLFEESESSKIKPLVLRLEYDNGGKWRTMLDDLRTVPVLQTLDIGAVGLSYGEVTLFYQGDNQQIAKALRARGYVVDDSRAYWVIK